MDSKIWLALFTLIATPTMLYGNENRNLKLRVWPVNGDRWKYPECREGVKQSNYNVKYIAIIHPRNRQDQKAATCNCYLSATGSTEVENVFAQIQNNFIAQGSEEFHFQDWGENEYLAGKLVISVTEYGTYTSFKLMLNADKSRQYSLFDERRITLRIEQGTMSMSCSNNSLTDWLLKSKTTSSFSQGQTLLTTQLKILNDPDRTDVTNKSLQLVTTTDSIFKMAANKQNSKQQLPVIIGSILICLIFFTLMLIILVLFVTKDRILKYCIKEKVKQEDHLKNNIKSRNCTPPQGVLEMVKKEKILEDRCVYATGEKYYCITHDSNGSSQTDGLLEKNQQAKHSSKIKMRQNDDLDGKQLFNDVNLNNDDLDDFPPPPSPLTLYANEFQEDESVNGTALNNPVFTCLAKQNNYALGNPTTVTHPINPNVQNANTMPCATINDFNTNEPTSTQSGEDLSIASQLVKEINKNFPNFRLQRSASSNSAEDPLAKWKSNRSTGISRKPPIPNKPQNIKHIKAKSQTLPTNLNNNLYMGNSFDDHDNTVSVDSFPTPPPELTQEQAEVNSQPERNKYAKIGSNHERINLPNLYNFENNEAANTQCNGINSNTTELQQQPHDFNYFNGTSQEEQTTHYAQIDLNKLAKREAPSNTSNQQIVYAQLDLKKK